MTGNAAGDGGFPPSGRGGYAGASEQRQVIEIPAGCVAVEIVTGSDVRTINLPAGCRELVLITRGGGRGGASSNVGFGGGVGSAVILGESHGGGARVGHDGDGGAGDPGDLLHNPPRLITPTDR